MKKMFIWGLLLSLCLSLLAGCQVTASFGTTTGQTDADGPASTVTTPSPKPSTAQTTTVTDLPAPPTEPEIDPAEVIARLLATTEVRDDLFCADYLAHFAARYGTDRLIALENALSDTPYTRDVWYAVTGNSYFVLRDVYLGAHEESENIRLISLGNWDGENATTRLTFGGDICLADNYLPMQAMKKNGRTILDCIDPKLVALMKSDDVTLLTNEFAISDRGTPMAGKKWTFRAAVANTALYNDLGVDLVSLANNHVYDYGKDAFLDTLSALDTYGIDAIGGGADLAEAMRPMYYLINGRKIAFVAASRAEKYKLTPEATATSPGILRCYDTAKFLQVIAEAEANSDFVIASIHWGTEYSAKLESAQTTTARAYIDAGVDLIIGSHAHCLQGIEYYKGKAIFYNMGNFWFNDTTLDSGMVQVELFHDGSTQNTFIPALQKNCITTSELGTAEGARILDWMEAHSVGVNLAEDGKVTPSVQ